MKNAKSFKEIMDRMKEKHPELTKSFEEMEKVISEKEKDDLCLLYGCKKRDEGK